MENKDSLNLFDQSLIVTIPFTIVLSVVLFFVTGNSNGEVKSLIVGEVLSLILNLWNSRATLNIGQRDYKKLKSFSIISFLLRYSIIIAFVLLSTTLSDFHPIYLVFGLCEYSIALTIISIFSGRRSQND